jgi:eukaryotic-like serine/threonine-protein kinase
VTRSWQVLGTPHYMAPEQAESRLGPVGPATDVYALGVILYELLTGRPPFDGPTPVEVVRRLLAEEALSPSRLQPGIPRDLVTVCQKCLRKEPLRRYESALALAEDLGRFGRHESVRARPVGAAGRLWRWCRRRPGLAGLTAALLASLVAGFAAVTLLWLTAEGHRRGAEAGFADADRQRKAADEARNQEAGQRRRSEAHLYVSRIAQARLEWEFHRLGEMRLLLERAGPARARPTTAAGSGTTCAAWPTLTCSRCPRPTWSSTALRSAPTAAA